jgi:eukaryotic-like serine/threonine-protein kinase
MGPALIGATVGNYKIVEKIGEGGMGAVYRAEHSLIGRGVAVKVLLPELSKHEEVLTRFFNEARASSLIHHPGIVEVFDYGHHESGSAYLVMELLTGESLAARLRRERKLRSDVIFPLLRQIAGALGAAHAQDIVHRDLKPDNIFLVADPDVPGGLRAKILDFGIAKLAASASGLRTKTGAVMGTPPYMAPEQTRGAGKVDARADIYAVGCILFEMAAGRPPFAAKTHHEMMALHQSAAPPKLRAIDPSISPVLEALVARALAKHPADRQQSMAELAADLDRPQSGATLAVDDATRSERPPPKKKARKREWGWLLPVLFVGAAAAVAAFFAARHFAR